MVMLVFLIFLLWERMLGIYCRLILFGCLCIVFSIIVL